MMMEIEVSPLLAEAYASHWKKLEASGREIDQEFIRRGFVSVQAEIDFMQRVFGPASYQAFLDSQSSPEGFQRFRVREDEVRQELAAVDRSSKKAFDEMWEAILGDPLLPSPSKSTLLGGLSRERYGALVEPYIPSLLAARRDTELKVCTLYPEPATLLYDKNKSFLRKEVCNAVMADAYGALGFSAFRRKRGLDSFYKRLTPEYAVIAEPDIVLLEKHYTGQRWSPWVYWPLISFDMFSHLCSSGNNDKRRFITFLPVTNCVATLLLHRYDDTRSLEVMIRANALWHELTIAPFEHAVKELSSS